jgi:GTP-binding protein HflX
MLTPGNKMNVIFVHLADPKLGKSEVEKDITEIWNLTLSLGNTVINDIFIQKSQPHPAMYIGPGKAAEIALYLQSNPVDAVIFNGHLTSGQKFNLTKEYWNINPKIEIWDRTDLILSIFSRHAHTREAKLQIELARMRHMGPRIYGMGLVLSRQAGGIGTRGIGETNIELMKRHWKREIKRVTDGINALMVNRRRQMENRKNLGLKTVSLVGYTSAGKTTLFNLLTGKHHFTDKMLFATLDSSVGEVYLTGLGKNVIVSDTIGFIRDLPPDLIEAFKSTLLESVNADVVLHVIDSADPDMWEKVQIAAGILKQLGVAQEKIIPVFNKVDAIDKTERDNISRKLPSAPYAYISAKTGEGADILMSIIGKMII